MKSSNLNQIISQEKRKRENMWIFIGIGVVIIIIASWFGYTKIKEELNNTKTGSAVVYPENFRMVRKFFRQFQEPEIGDKAALFRLQDLNDEVYELESELDKPVLLVFQYTSCPTCTAMEPDLQKFEKDYKDKVEVITVGVKEDKQKIIDYVNEKNITRKWLIDEDYTVSLAYRVGSVPEMFLINNDREIIYITSGDFESLVKEVKKL